MGDRLTELPLAHVPYMTVAFDVWNVLRPWS